MRKLNSNKLINVEFQSQIKIYCSYFCYVKLFIGVNYLKPYNLLLIAAFFAGDSPTNDENMGPLVCFETETMCPDSEVCI